MQQKLIRAGFMLTILSIIPAAALAEDAITAMCTERDDEGVCSCASTALLSQIGQEDYALYEAIGEDYLARMASGESRVDAWMAASRTAATNRGISSVVLMGRTNEIGKTHRTAIKECGG